MEIAIESIQDIGVKLPTYYRNNNLPEIIACVSGALWCRVLSLCALVGLGSLTYFISLYALGFRVRDF